MKSTHSGRLERWLGREQLDGLTASMRGWYGPPIAVQGVPGEVYATGDGDFVGPILGGHEISAVEHMWLRARRAARLTGRRHGTLQAGGFATLADFLAAMAGGNRQNVPFLKQLSAPNATGFASSAWFKGDVPIAATATAAATPGGTAYSASSTGAMRFTNAKSGQTLFCAGGLFAISGSSSQSNILLYDRLFGVLKTVSSTTAEAVTGVPTRYQSTTATDPNYAGGNFVFPDIFATNSSIAAHNWTVCQYTNQAGTPTQSIPSIAGGQASSAASQIDLPAFRWFMPLATGDIGVKALTQLQVDASMTGATLTAEMVIGHPIAWFPVGHAGSSGMQYPIDGVRSAFSLARVFDDACLSFMHVTPSVGATVLHGEVVLVQG